jgi:spore germination protein GerM
LDEEIIMYKPKPNKSRLLLGAIAGLLVAVVATSCGTTPETQNSLPSAPSPTAEADTESPSVARSPEEPAMTETSQKSPAQVAQTTKEETVQVYWLDANAQTVKLVPSAVTIENKSAAQPDTLLTTAFEQLLARPKTETQTTSIPEGTRLLGVRQEADGVRVNLSEDFTKGGGTMSMTGRLAQVLYTATTLDPNAKVWLEVEGKPLEVLGGEGLIIEQPLTRQSFEKDFDL